MILLSAHKDTVLPHPPLGFMHGHHVGLLDNWMGMFVVYAALYQCPSLLVLESQDRLRIFHSAHEEFLLDDMPPWNPDLVLVVDVVSGKRYEGYDGALENISLPPQPPYDEILSCIEGLEKEGYHLSLKTFTGEETDEDESWVWRKKGVPVMTLLIPVQGDWHHPSCTCSSLQVHKSITLLTRIVSLCDDLFHPCLS